MGIIQRQSIRSTILTMLAFLLGAFNILFLSPKFLTPQEFGLTRLINDVGLLMATTATMGCLPIIYKFFPFYKSYLKADKDDLPFLTGIVCLVGLVLVCLGGYWARHLVVEKYSERSPLFVTYSYLVYPFAICMLVFIWLEGFVWSFKKGVSSNAIREVVPRSLFTVMMVLMAIGLIRLKGFLWIYSISFLIPSILLFVILRRTGEFEFVPRVSSVTYRLRGKMINFGLFLFGAQFLNLLSRTADTFILSSKSTNGLADAAVFVIASYVVTLMEIPQRSITSITIPVLAESWKNKDLKNIRNVYVKSVNNLLIIGLLIFFLTWLNVHDLARYLGKDYAGIETLVFFMGIGKLIDLGTGANAQVIATSSFWKVDFFTNVFYTLLALPLNYILISHYHLMGAAYATLISLTFYNLMRLGFLWYKLGIQPYTWKDVMAVGIAGIAAAAAYYTPYRDNFILDALQRTVVFVGIFAPGIYFSKASMEMNQLLEKYLGMTKRW